MRTLGTFLVVALLACGHGGLGVNVTRIESSEADFAEGIKDVEARPGGFTARVQFNKYKSRPPMITASVEGSRVVISVDRNYPSRYKCLSAETVRVDVDGLPPGDYEVVARIRGELVEGEHPIAVAEPGNALAKTQVVVRDLGC